MYYTVYKITNKQNGKYYIGKHQTKTLDDNYVGSGRAIKQAIQKYGIRNFRKEFLFIFDNEKEMNEKEKELVVLSEMSYNLSPGGKGGFGYINLSGMNRGANNVMRINLVAKEKCIQNAMTTRLKSVEKYNQISRINLSKAHMKQKGIKRPNHSMFMQNWAKKHWENNKEKMRNALSSWFEIISPAGERFETNRLQEFCKEKGINYVGVWNTSRTLKPINQGKNKGWLCQKI